MEIERDRWYGSVVSELNLKAAVLLSEGKITQEEYDTVVTENLRQSKENS